MTLSFKVLAVLLAVHGYAIALTVRFVPAIIDLDEAAAGWTLGTEIFGLALGALLGVRVWRDLAPLRDPSPDAAPRRRRAAHDFPFQIARLYFTGAVVAGALTWPWLTWSTRLSFTQTLAGAVTTYLLLAVPVLLLYHATRQLLRREASGPAGAGPSPGLRQSVRLRVGLAVQLPVVICMAGLVLVEQSNAQQYTREVNAFYEHQYANVLSRALLALPDLEARRAAVARLDPPEGVETHTGEAPGAEEVGVVVDADLSRPLSLRLPPLLLFAAVAVFAALLGRWLSREVIAELRAAQRALEALRRAPEAVPAVAGGPTMAETAALVEAWRATLEGFRERRDALARATSARRDAEAAKARFLAHLSHELKSPLNTILGFSEVLLAGLDGPLTTAQRERLGILWRAGEGLLRFILSLLDLARLEAADTTVTAELTPVATGPRPLAQALQEQWRKDPLERVRLEVVVAPGAEESTARVDVQRTARAALLCAGALLDAVESGTARVELSARPAGGLRVTIGLGPHVADAHDAPRLWRQLAPGASGAVRMNAAATALALVRRTMELQGGALAVEPGPWPTFVLDLSGAAG